MGDETGWGATGGGGPEPLPFPVFVLFEAALAPLALVLGWALGIQPLADFSWDAKAVLAGVAAALPMLGFLAVAVRWPIGPIARIKSFFDRELAPVLEGCEWPDLALISLAAGVGEEMLFRGVIQGGLTRALGPAGGVASAALLFGLLHPVSAWYIAIASLLGAYLGVVWLASGNLLTVMVAHAVYDLIALVVLLQDRKETQAEDG